MNKDEILQEYNLQEEDLELLDKMAKKIVDIGMTAPAILFIESFKPMSFIGSQIMVFFEPYVKIIFSANDYTRVHELMSDRENIELFLQRMEYFEAEKSAEERRQKKIRSANKESLWKKIKKIFKK